ncbi:decapping endonuclease targeting mRNA [Tulasnella sp. JGI-2019a]|nr:decapping endonuclease targeting mRNA [Tulasnella sp. JGI-2019a]
MESTHPETLIFPLPSLRAVAPPPVQRPIGLLTFSYTPERTLVFDNSAMKYYKDPPLNVSLQRDYKNWIKRPEERTRLDGLLQCLEKDQVKAEASRCDVVTWRGIMTKIITAPYESRDGWELNVMLLGGTLYLEEHVNDNKLSEKETMEPRHRLMSYYGYSFESYCTTPNPPDPSVRPADWCGTVDTNVQWCSVVKTKISDTRIILGAEVDCVRDRFTGQPSTFVELKTSRAIRNARDEGIFRSKLLKFWAQSFLLGIPEVIVGFRTDDGTLISTQSFNTSDLPNRARGKSGEWSTGVCLDFGGRFLSYVRQSIQHQQTTPEDTKVWRVRFQPRAGIELRELVAAEIEGVRNGEDRVGFLPRPFWMSHT